MKKSIYETFSSTRIENVLFVSAPKLFGLYAEGIVTPSFSITSSGI
jgi:hypothetical protein